MLIAAQGGNQLVACCCERAEAAGVRAGMNLAHARSLLGGLTPRIRPFTQEEDAQNLRRLARWALRFSPLAAPDPPDGLLLDIAGCEHLFGGDHRLVEKMLAALEQFGFPAQAAVTPTFACARVVARYGGRRIAFVAEDAVEASVGPLPVATLRLDPVAVEALAEVGIERIDQLFGLPREELAARFGGELLGRLDQALGRVPESIEPVRPEQRLEVSRVLDGPVERLEAIHLVVRGLLADLVSELARREQGVVQLHLELRRLGAEPARLGLSLTYPTRDRAHLWSLLLPRLERVNLGYGVEEVTLWAVRTGRVDLAQVELWPGGVQDKKQSNGSALGRLLDQLIDRLGNQAVHQVTPVESYVPERAFEDVAAGDVAGKPLRLPSPLKEKGVGRATSKKSGSRSNDGRSNLFPGKRPSRLFELPEPAEVISLVPDGPPAWLEWRGKAGAVLAARGPERLAFPWWTGRRDEGTKGRRRDGGTLDASRKGPAPGRRDELESRKQGGEIGISPQRNYYEVQDERGRWLWLFRDGESGLWFVHGEWA